MTDSLRGRYFLSARLLLQAIVRFTNIENLYLCDDPVICACIVPRLVVGSRDRDIRAKEIECLDFTP